jgi:hypothetical protein
MQNHQKAKKSESQRDRFIDAARDLECDDDKDRFEKRLGKIAKAKAKPKDAKAPR